MSTVEEIAEMVARAKRGTTSGRVSEVGADAVRKQGRAFRLRREVEAMQFVARRTSIPVPRITETHLDASADPEDLKALGWIVMERMRGRSLGDAWPAMTEGARERTLSQLKGFIEQLRRLDNPHQGRICSCSGGPAYDHRIDNVKTCGPFASVGEFHDFLVVPVKESPRPDWADRYRRVLSDNSSVLFSHSDLSWENILVDEASGDVTAVLDWEMAGFWPEWWEYRKALYGSRGQPWWREFLAKIMDEYTAETEADEDLEMY
ncbi:phosphotransferase enzyme family domain-containing protein [Purpureocillium lavendulum]|uniref:Phosphotransferase enzyme family domain-containing protein n=1 Tax=Purpureocillium lavendulum TaxID=1247861 RepID=A0AB34G1I0_9HYPO|nr:phosphotransferase enzyme family domain-containing protein [Purpureocillium lavendulum]